jgi:AraC-like DNA-binding protein
MYNINETILLVAAIQGFLLFLGLVTKKTNNKLSNISIGLIVFVIAITILFSWGSASKYNNSPAAIPFWIVQSNLLVPAAFWIFLNVNTTPKFKFKNKYWLLFLPAGFEIGVQICLKSFPLLVNNQLVHAFIKSKIWFFFIEILPLFATISLLLLYARRLWQIMQKFREFKNPALPAYFRRMLSVLILMSVLLIVWTSSTYYLVQYRIVEIVLVSSIFLLGYIAYFKPDFFEIPKDILAKDPAARLFPQFDDKTALLRLDAAFKEQQLHLRPKLTVTDLAAALNLPAKYVTYLINNYHARNFNDFVNRFRVDEVIARMTDPSEKNKSLAGIALDAGFNSKSSFNQVFKQHTGKTPSTYLP